jgi:hypothetical protein
MVVCSKDVEGVAKPLPMLMHDVGTGTDGPLPHSVCESARLTEPPAQVVAVSTPQLQAVQDRDSEIEVSIRCLTVYGATDGHATSPVWYTHSLNGLGGVGVQTWPVPQWSAAGAGVHSCALVSQLVGGSVGDC